MQFKTTLSPDSWQNRLAYQDGLVFLGSCFAESMGKRMLQLKFNAQVNALGIVYNPISLAQHVEMAVDNAKPSRELCLQRENRCLSYLHHSTIQADSFQALESIIGQQQQKLRTALSSAHTVFVTLGTAWAFQLCADGETTVANCHKQPAELFNRQLFSVEQIVNALESMHSKIRQLNSDVQLVLTVSPVRHLRDGFVQNNLGKAHLLAAVHQVTSQSGDNVHYFPAYELLLDDLRDYRFYADDLAHPNALAEQYIFEAFTKAALTMQAQELLSEVERLQRAAEHRLFNPDVDSSRQFAAHQLKRIASLEQRMPNADFSTEKEHFRNIIAQK